MASAAVISRWQPWLRSGVQLVVRPAACILASSRWEPALLGRPSPSEARLGYMSNLFLVDAASVARLQILRLRVDVEASVPKARCETLSC